MGRSGSYMRIVVIAFVLLSLIGCARHRLPRENEKVSRLKEIAVVVDTTVTHARSMKALLLSVPENEAIAARLGTLTADALRTKGYAPLPPIHTVGMTSQGRLKVHFSASTGTAAPEPVSPPFLIAPKSDGITDEGVRNLFSKANGGLLPKEYNPFEPTPVMVISAQGNFISGGAMVANIGKGFLQALLFLGGEGANVMNKDTLTLSFRLFDPISGALLWHDQIEKSGNPDEATFARLISKMLKRLPNARNERKPDTVR
ncbi:MAG TPA: hypothetical protein DCO77_00925 [Nitrospiraceae bacterium]|nr:hypothetical protein [Nitrospiraceae bacterium]